MFGIWFMAAAFAVWPHGWLALGESELLTLECPVHPMCARNS
jgi:hypothetical protein